MSHSCHTLSVHIWKGLREAAGDQYTFCGTAEDPCIQSVGEIVRTKSRDLLVTEDVQEFKKKKKIPIKKVSVCTT